MECSRRSSRTAERKNGERTHALQEGPDTVDAIRRYKQRFVAGHGASRDEAHVYRGDRSNDDDEQAPKERKVQNASAFAGTEIRTPARFGCVCSVAKKLH